MTNLDDKFIKSYLNRSGFWYAFKRSVNDIGNLLILFRYLQVYEGLNWHNQQKEFSNILIKEKLLIPSKNKEDSSANSRGIKKVLELLGLCFVDKNEKLQITQMGKKFLNSSSNEELYDIKTNQLLKYQINNPLIRSGKFKEMQIKPFVFLLKLLSKLDNQSINSLEYKLFVSRAHHMDELQEIINQIIYWRGLNENEKENFKNKIMNSEIFHKISGYAGYSMVFFGKSSLTEITDHNDEKIIFLKKNKIQETYNILWGENIIKYQSNLDQIEDFMGYYGGLQNKEKNNNEQKKILKTVIKKEKLIYDDFLTKEEKEKLISNKKIEDIFFLSGRTINILTNENIIYLKDLLIWQEQNLKQMQGLGSNSINEIKEQLSNLNKKNNINLDFNNPRKSNIDSLVENNLNKNLFIKIDEIDFSVRTMNCLKDEKIFFLGDLVTRTQGEMMRFRNFGRQSLQEVKNILDSMSLYLGMQISWPPENNLPSKEINYDKSTKFIYLSDEDQINCFRSIETTFENVRVLNACKNLEIENLGDLHQKLNSINRNEEFYEKNNLGSKSIELMKITMFRYISKPLGFIIEDWEETKKKQFEKFDKKLESKINKENSKDFENLQYLDDEINLLMNKINFKRQDIIDFHYGLDGSGIKTLNISGVHFGVTRERIRQITSKYIRIVSKKKITGLIILKKVEELLNQLYPISCIKFEKYLLDNNIVKKRYLSSTLLSLFNFFLNKNNFLLLEGRSIIDYKKNPKYSKLIKFVYSNFNSYGCINTSFLSKKFEISVKQVIDLLSLENDISFIGEKWVYDNDKNRNRLFNILQKIFNVTSEVNKFELSQAIKRSRRIKYNPPFEAISTYCQKELNATVDSFNISIPKDQISKFRYNSKVEILSPIEFAIINSFKNSKILTFNQLTNKLLDQNVNPNTAAIYASGNTPITVKVYPGCYVLVGTKLDTGEADEFYKKNKEKGSKIITDYDHNEDGSIWIGYEINEKIRSGRNFSVSNSIYDVLKGKYNVKGMNHKINIANKSINKVSNEIFKNKFKIGEEVVFTFDINKKNVEIEMGERVMKAKYN